MAAVQNTTEEAARQAAEFLGGEKLADIKMALDTAVAGWDWLKGYLPSLSGIISAALASALTASLMGGGAGAGAAVAGGGLGGLLTGAMMVAAPIIGGAIGYGIVNSNEKAAAEMANKYGAIAHTPMSEADMKTTGVGQYATGQRGWFSQMANPGGKEPTIDEQLARAKKWRDSAKAMFDEANAKWQEKGTIAQNFSFWGRKGGLFSTDATNLEAMSAQWAQAESAIRNLEAKKAEIDKAVPNAEAKAKQEQNKKETTNTDMSQKITQMEANTAKANFYLTQMSDYLKQLVNLMQAQPNPDTSSKKKARTPAWYNSWAIPATASPNLGNTSMNYL